MDWEFESKTAGGETLNNACSDAFFRLGFPLRRLLKKPSSNP